MFHIAAPSVASIDSGISNAVRESSKLSMTKVLENGKTKIAISAEKEPGKKTAPILLKNNGYFSSQLCDFSL